MYIRRSIRPGIERLLRDYKCPRHQHIDAYVTVVLEGSFEQAGYFGRMVVRAGDVLLQPTLDCHANRMLSTGLRLLRIPWEWDDSFGGVFRSAESESIRIAAARDPVEAKHLLKQLFRNIKPIEAAVHDWEDVLFARIKMDSSIRIDQFAHEVQLSRETVYRGFSEIYGVSPSRLRGEMRARRAWSRATDCCETLSNIASETGFSDQSHMTREVKRLTGATPANWRRYGKSRRSASYLPLESGNRL